MSALQGDIEDLQRRYDGGLTADDAGEDDLAVLEEFLQAFEAGEVRAAEWLGPPEAVVSGHHQQEQPPEHGECQADVGYVVRVGVDVRVCGDERRK